MALRVVIAQQQLRRRWDIHQSALERGFEQDQTYLWDRKCIQPLDIFAKEVDAQVVILGLGQPRPPGLHCVSVAYTCDLHNGDSTMEPVAAVDLVLVRSQQFVERVRRLPAGKSVGEVIWWPFSVDERLVPPWVPWEQREPGIGFAGYSGAKMYPKREAAVSGRNDVAKYVRSHTDHGMAYSSYLRWMSRYKGCIATSSAYRLLVAKHFEIPAAGCALLTCGQAHGIDEVLPARYRYDLSTTAEQIDEKHAVKLRDIVMTKHTHEVRGEQLRAKICTML